MQSQDQRWSQDHGPDRKGLRGALMAVAGDGSECQNPYVSMVVSASAGTGKTYQLAMRYLFLVASGADPRAILSLTFTQKAAAEMRSRIVDLATSLLDDVQSCQAYEDKLAGFHGEYLRYTQSHQLLPPLPALSFYEAAQRICEAHREDSLSIMTIDALFLQWVQMYLSSDDLKSYPRGFKNITAWQRKDMSFQAWQQLFPWPFSHDRSQCFQEDDAKGREREEAFERGIAPVMGAYNSLQDLDPYLLPWDKVTRLVQTLASHDLHLRTAMAEEGRSTESYVRDYLQEACDVARSFGGDIAACFAAPVILQDMLDASLWSSWLQRLDAAFFEQLQPHLKILVMAVDRLESMKEAVQVQSMQEFCQGPIITKKKRTVSLTKVSRAQRQKPHVLASTEAIDALVAGFLYICDLRMLACAMHHTLHVYLLWRKELGALKKEQGLLDYDDITWAASLLFQEGGDKGGGDKGGSDEDAFYVLQQRVKHVLVDELQDSSAIQMRIFLRLATEFLASQDTPLPRTVFMVGDAKQCLYGFREAHLMMMDHVLAFFQQREKPCYQLTRHYRSCQSVLDFIHGVFAHRVSLPHYAPLQCAQGHDGVPLKQDLTVIEVLPRVPPTVSSSSPSPSPSPQDPDESLVQASAERTGVLGEAHLLAQKLVHIFRQPGDYPVCCAEGLRGLRLSDVVVLYRDGTHASTLQQVLMQWGVPCRVEKSGALLNRSEIQDVLALMRYILYPSSMQCLLQVCKSPILGWDDEMVLAAWQDSTTTSASSVTAAPPRRTVDLVQQLQKVLAKDGDTLQCQDFERIQRCLLWSSSSSLSSHGEQGLFCECMLKLLYDLRVEEKYRHCYGDQGELAADNIRQLRMYLSEASTQRLSAYGQLAYLEQRLSEQVRTTVSHGGGGGSNKDHNVVRLMTIHQAKGLEFPMVCLTQTCDHFFTIKGPWVKSESRGKLYPWSLMRDLWSERHLPSLSSQGAPLWQKVQQEVECDRYHEGKRLLYVALTRASQYLVISGHTKKIRFYRSKVEDPLFYDTLLAAAQELVPDVTLQRTDDEIEREHAEGDELQDAVAVAVDAAEDEEGEDGDEDEDTEEDLADYGVCYVSPQLQQYRLEQKHEPPQLHQHRHVEPVWSPQLGHDMASVTGDYVLCQPHAMTDQLLRGSAASEVAAASLSLSASPSASRSFGGSWFQGVWHHQRRDLRALMGTLVHRLLECSVKAQAWQGQDEGLLLEITHHAEAAMVVEHTHRDRMVEEVLAGALKEAHVSYKWLCDYTEPAEHCYSELLMSTISPPPDHPSQASSLLLMGKADLVVQFSDRVEVIDYKTLSSLDGLSSQPQTRLQELKTWAQKKGYDEQLRAYGMMVESLFGPLPVKTAIFLTRTCELITL